MKTIYQKPSIEVIMSFPLLMTASQPTYVEDGFDTSDVPTTDATSGNLSRRNLWDDEGDFDDVEF